MKVLKILMVLILLNLSCAFPFLGLWPIKHWGHIPLFDGGATMWLVYIILVGVIVYLIITSQKKIEEKGVTPLEILKKRYAKGEITKEEFKKIKKDLED